MNPDLIAITAGNMPERPAEKKSMKLYLDADLSGQVLLPAKWVTR